MDGCFKALNFRQFATPEDMSRVFIQHRPELRWFAYFIAGDEDVAEACVVDARAVSTTHNQVFSDWLLEWARYATIRAAIQVQKERLVLQARTFDHLTCSHTHEPLQTATIDFILQNSEALIKRLDALSRVALVLCGFEKHPVGEAAVLAGVSAKILRAAYCAALQSLEVLQCELMTAEQDVEHSYN